MSDYVLAKLAELEAIITAMSDEEILGLFGEASENARDYVMIEKLICSPKEIVEFYKTEGEES